MFPFSGNCSKRSVPRFLGSWVLCASPPSVPNGPVRHADHGAPPVAGVGPGLRGVLGELPQRRPASSEAGLQGGRPRRFASVALFFFFFRRHFRYVFPFSFFSSAFFSGHFFVGVIRRFLRMGRGRRWLVVFGFQWAPLEWFAELDVHLFVRVWGLVLFGLGLD